MNNEFLELTKTVLEYNDDAERKTSFNGGLGRVLMIGVAKANEIVANGLGGAEGYLRYLAIDAMRAQSQNGNTTIYVATEAGIPITEAMRFNKPN